MEYEFLSITSQSIDMRLQIRHRTKNCMMSEGLGDNDYLDMVDLYNDLPESQELGSISRTALEIANKETCARRNAACRCRF